MGGEIFDDKKKAKFVEPGPVNLSEGEDEVKCVDTNLERKGNFIFIFILTSAGEREVG